VTCLYRGVPASTLGSWLESAGISTDFCPGILAAVQVEGGLHFGLGSTLAFRRTDLAKIGGFEGFLDYLADDYELGRRISELGLEVKLSESIVDTFLPSYSLPQFFAHQLRWARTIRTSRPWGFVSLVFTFGLFWGALIVVAAKGAAWSWALFAIAFALRLLMAIVVAGSVLKQSNLPSLILLLPLRDLLAVIVWLGSFLGNTVKWRGESFRLQNGKLSRIIS
jgi:ceramide glucosyltransferase